MKTIPAVVSLIVTMSSAGPVLAGDICAAHSKTEWMSADALKTKATELGYEVRKIKEEDGCWEVKGFKDGKKVEVYFDPVSAKIVKTKVEG